MPQELFHIVKEMNLSVVDVDSLTDLLWDVQSQPHLELVIGWFGHLIHANGLKLNCPNDERKSVFELPDFIIKMKEKTGLK